MTLIKPGPDFAQLFQTFEHTAFRLETRDRYNSPREAEAYRKFLAGEPDTSFHEGWLNMVRRATAEGRRFSRVRAVSVPLTDYTRFSMWVSGFRSAEGFDRDPALVGVFPARGGSSQVMCVAA